MMMRAFSAPPVSPSTVNGHQAVSNANSRDAVQPSGSQSWELITPERAKYIFERSRPFNFRSFRLSVGKRYSGDMSAGRWDDNGEPIQMTDDEIVWNGQHRLWAIADSGIPRWMWVYHGERKDRGIDSHTPRTAADYLTNIVEHNAKQVAAVAKIVICHELGGLHSFMNVKWSNSEICECVERHPKMPEYARIAMHARAVTKASLLGYVIYAGCEMVSQRPQERAVEFVEEIANGAGLVEGSPVLLYRNRMLADRVAKARLRNDIVAALTIKAWNAWVRGVKLQSLRWRTSADSKPESFPAVI